MHPPVQLCRLRTDAHHFFAAVYNDSAQRVITQNVARDPAWKRAVDVLGQARIGGDLTGFKQDVVGELLGACRTPRRSAHCWARSAFGWLPGQRKRAHPTGVPVASSAKEAATLTFGFMRTRVA
ncbi:hypothetical protein DDD63_10840 [Actinobaculum sp. 313]|nr:hypothetical protein DDD63_10840 [Actinobaculum sp. 313]